MATSGNLFATIEAAAPDPSRRLAELAGGAVTWPQLLSSGRFQLTGDPFLALRFASLFRLPVVLEPASAHHPARPEPAASGS